ncbi:hypothetical protein LguiA_003467 [Lonicera macranthoides]
MSICLACGNCSLRSPYHAENATDKNHPVSVIKVCFLFFNNCLRSQCIYSVEFYITFEVQILLLEIE